jgi:putative sigma-54 modulation protein
MQVNITFRQLEPTEALKSHVQDKVQHIQRYIDSPTEAHAVLRVENLHHHAEITMRAGPFSLRGRARSEDMYASIDAAAEKIERQLKKHKERVRDHKSTHIPHDWTPVDVRHEILEEPKATPAARVVSSSTFQARPMSLDEAIVQLDLLNSRFYVFQNAKSRALNVVYRREDGTLGLVEASAA